ncbi:DUF2070 family protein [Candidatus Bathyarchaeota archaeon]|nr:DUF2070 family protein [Candidatus Bathyarchaeota archaeon]
MNRAVQHYSSLFKLPSYEKMLLLQALMCLSGGSLSVIILFSHCEMLIGGLFLGISLFLVNFVADNIVSILILKHDSIYDLRRITGLSLFSWGFWLPFNFLGVAIATIFGLPWWIRLCLLGFSAVIILRSIVLLSTSPAHYGHVFAGSLLQPFFCVIPFLVFWLGVGYAITVFAGFFFIFSSALGVISSFVFVYVLNYAGQQTLRIPSIPLFKAFLLNWIMDLNVPFEEFLERLGENQNVEVSLLQFSSSKPKAIIAVPSIHPGPFKNIGSSLLPSMLKTALEKKLECVVCVPHGLFGHEFDLASQIQSQKVINRVAELANHEGYEVTATSFTKASNGLATVCCQIFGNIAFLSFTLAPKTTEDLPQELGMFAREECKKYGLDCCVVVNSHNSINGMINVEEALDALKTVLITCLKKAVSLKQFSFEVGAATIVPQEFGLRDGMGPGGIAAVVVRVGQQKTAYVVIDGNNMVSGLREHILSAMNSIGVDEGEVFTTDTHSVSAVILGNRGYYPIGEAIPHNTIIRYVRETILGAMSNLEPVKAACNSITIPAVKVIGEKQLEKLCLLIDNTLQKAKKAIIPILVTDGLLLMLILMFV